MARALIVEDDATSMNAMALLVEDEGFETSTASTLEKARLRIMEERPDVILCDLMLPDGKGTDLLRELETNDNVEVIMVTGQASVDTAVEALRLGAYDYLTKPVDASRLVTLLAGVRRTQGLKKEVSSLRDELRQLGRFGPLVGTSKSMQKVYDLIQRVAVTDATVLIVGESGTGKDLVAQALHDLSSRREEAYLPLNCGAISATLIETELFGHERGSFTGANRQHQGYFERADAGTLFLDEITEMPIEMQVKLLRILETGALLRVGGTKPIQVDVRMLAATNRDPVEAVRDGHLREDLYYRLKVFPIHLPPLRDREGDVEILANHFISQLSARQDTRKVLRTDSLKLLESYNWPGNVRELKHVLERAFILADEEIEPQHLALEGPSLERSTTSGPKMDVKIGSSIAEVERRLILATLDHLDGDKREVAEVLGISLKTLYNRLNSYKDEDEES